MMNMEIYKDGELTILLNIGNGSIFEPAGPLTLDHTVEVEGAPEGWSMIRLVNADRIYAVLLPGCTRFEKVSPEPIVGFLTVEVI
jgi:hypothetical protein